MNNWLKSYENLFSYFQLFSFFVLVQDLSLTSVLDIPLASCLLPLDSRYQKFLNKTNVIYA